LIQDFRGKPLRAFVIWEPVLPTDWMRPSTATLGRIPDLRVDQFWDKGRLVSHMMGEHNRRSVVWDYIAVYKPGQLWAEAPPDPLYHGGPVVRVLEPARAALAQTLSGE
jgi:hypothetical protein